MPVDTPSHVKVNKSGQVKGPRKRRSKKKKAESVMGSIDEMLFQSPSSHLISGLDAMLASDNFRLDEEESLEDYASSNHNSSSFSLELLVQDLSKLARVATSEMSPRPMVSPRRIVSPRLNSLNGEPEKPQRRVSENNFMRTIVSKYDHERDARVALAISLAEGERDRRMNLLADLRYHEKLDRARNLEWAIQATEAERKRHARIEKVYERRYEKTRKELKKKVIGQEEVERQRRIRRGADDDIVLRAARTHVDAHVDAHANTLKEDEESDDVASNVSSDLNSLSYSDEDLATNTFVDDYEVVCPYTILGCTMTCMRSKVQEHLACCSFRSSDDRDSSYNPLSYIIQCPYASLGCQHACPRASLPLHLRDCVYHDNSIHLEQYDYDTFDFMTYEVVCPYTTVGCTATVLRPHLSDHLAICQFAPPTRQEEEVERAENKIIAIEAAELERERRMLATPKKDGEYRLLLTTLLKERFSKDAAAHDSPACHKKSPSSNSSLGSLVSSFVTPVSDIEGSGNSRTLINDKNALWILKAAEIEALRNHLTAKVEVMIKQRAPVLRRVNSEPSILKKDFEFSRRKLRANSSSDRQNKFAIPPHRIPLQSYMERRSIDLNNKLHLEIIAFKSRISSEISEFNSTVDAICRNVRRAATVSFGYEAKIKIFGSFATDLAVPNISDLDLVVLNGVTEMPGPLMILGKVIQNATWVKSIKLLDRARMPVIKVITNTEPSMNVDITFALPFHAGLAAAVLVKNLQKRFEALNPLTLILKTFLGKKGFNDPFTGGLSSYALSLMVVASLNRSNEKIERNQHFDGSGYYGLLLFDFLELYGKEFDATEDAVVCLSGSNSGEYTICIGRRLYALSSPYTGADTSFMASVVVDDPLQAGNNTASTCFRFLELQKAFADSYAILLVQTARRTSSSNKSILDLII